MDWQCYVVQPLCLEYTLIGLRNQYHIYLDDVTGIK